MMEQGGEMARIAVALKTCPLRTKWNEAAGVVRRAKAGRHQMGRYCASFAVAAFVALGGSASMAPASAAPPTVVPSPGYDARLQEQHAARTRYAPVYQAVAPHHRPLPRHHAKRIRDGMH